MPRYLDGRRGASAVWVEQLRWQAQVDEQIDHLHCQYGERGFEVHSLVEEEVFFLDSEEAERVIEVTTEPHEEMNHLKQVANQVNRDCCPTTGAALLTTLTLLRLEIPQNQGTNWHLNGCPCHPGPQPVL